MKPSARCEAFIKGFEKCRLVAYLPTKKDKPTLGWGSTGPDIKLGMSWTQAHADARFATDLAIFSQAVSARIDVARTTQGQFDALVSLAYNIGAQAFAASTLLKLHNAGEYIGAAAQFARWNKQDGVALGGLTTRRAGEAAIYRGER